MRVKGYDCFVKASQIKFSFHLSMGGERKSGEITITADIFLGGR